MMFELLRLAQKPEKAWKKEKGKGKKGFQMISGQVTSVPENGLIVAGIKDLFNSC